MPSTAPTYYHWSQDKPCTTNQIYGFDQKAEMVKSRQMGTITKDGPFGYTRPFSNLGFFPEISHSNGVISKSDTARRARAALTKSAPVRRSTPLKMNEGYHMGYYPVIERVVKREYPADVRLSRFQSAPPTYKYAIPKEKDIYLWHTLSGCLVHARNPADHPSVSKATTCR